LTKRKEGKQKCDSNMMIERGKMESYSITIQGCKLRTV